MNIECWEVDGSHKMEGLSHSVDMTTFRGAPIKVVYACVSIALSVCVLVVTAIWNISTAHISAVLVLYHK